MSEGYLQVKARLDEIVEAVSDEDLPIDEALALYEEAVKLGAQVSKLIETDIAAYDETAEAQARAAEQESGVAADSASAQAPASASAPGPDPVPSAPETDKR